MKIEKKALIIGVVSFLVFMTLVFLIAQGMEDNGKQITS